MLRLPLGNKCWPIGLDLGADSVKMLQLRSSGEELAVQACARWRVPSSVRYDEARRNELTVEAVRDMLGSNPFHGRKVMTALRCSQLNIRNIRVPKMPEEELAEAVRWEASERFSFEVCPDTVRYLKAGEVRQGNDTQDEVILMVVQKEIADQHLALIHQMGLYPLCVGAEPVELFRTFERKLRRKADADTVSVVLDIGAEATRVVVARGRQIVFIKNINMAGRRLTEAAAKQLNLSIEEADQLRSLVMKEYADACQDSGSPDEAAASMKVSESVRWTIHDAVRGELEALAREIALCLRYCSVTFRGIRPESVAVTGGQAYDPSVVKLLSDQLGIDCRIGRPLHGVDVSDAPLGQDRRGTLAEWAVCAGLAVRDVEFEDTADDVDDGQHRLSA